VSDQLRDLDGTPKTEVRKALSVVKATRREQLQTVATKLGRRFIGIDIDASYLDLAAQRFIQSSAQTTLSL
jgi:hypothetical protein